MKILALNYGSSSIKFLVAKIDYGKMGLSSTDRLAQGKIDQIGEGRSTVRLDLFGEQASLNGIPSVSNHSEALRKIFEILRNYREVDLASIDAVGHRVVHGAKFFNGPVVVDEQVMASLEKLNDLAPLHNPISLHGIQATRGILGPKIPMVAVFDTVFHQTMPLYASTYAIPYGLAERHGIKRFGFHGIAHSSLIQGYETFQVSPRKDDRIISLHLGNGCSVAAMANGKSVDTSMGFSPLEGLVMGTRSGDLDPSIVQYLSQMEKVDVREVERWLNHESGLLGVSGRSKDMRVLLEAANREQDPRAKLAIDLFCYRAKKYIGAYLAALGGADAIIFGGGIGESSPEIRERICANMEWCGLVLDLERNNLAVGLSPGFAEPISNETADLPAYVVATDEESCIARETVTCLNKDPRGNPTGYSEEQRI